MAGIGLVAVFLMIFVTVSRDEEEYPAGRD